MESIIDVLTRSKKAAGRSTAWSWIPLAVFAVIATSCGGESADAPPAGGPQQAPPVTAAHPLVKSLVEWDRYTGRVTPVSEVDIKARVSGYLDSLHFEAGQLVQAGDLLAIIDPRPFEAELARVEAQGKQAEATRARADAMRGQADAQLRSANSAMSLTKSRLENAKEALANDAIAREMVDVRTAEFDQAESEVRAAEAAIALAEAEIATADAAIVSANAAIEGVRLELSYTTIKAPISGRIGDQLIKPGNLVQGGAGLAPTIATIVSTDPIHVYFDANEQEFLKYVRLAESGKRQSSRDVKNPVYIALIDEEGYPHRGHMDFVDNRIDPNTGTIRGRAIFRNEKDDLMPGLFATVRLPGTSRYDAVLIPDAAVQSSQESQFVFVLDDSDRATIRPVRLGPMIDGLRVVRDGLGAEDRVIINGLQRVRPGAPVAPTLETLELVESNDGLPNDYEPVPKDQWIRASNPKNADAANGDGR